MQANQRSAGNSFGASRRGWQRESGNGSPSAPDGPVRPVGPDSVHLTGATPAQPRRDKTGGAEPPVVHAPLLEMFVRRSLKAPPEHRPSQFTAESHAHGQILQVEQSTTGRIRRRNVSVAPSAPSKHTFPLTEPPKGLSGFLRPFLTLSGIDQAKQMLHDDHSGNSTFP